MSEILTTDCVKASQALAYWTDLICGVYVGLDCETPRRGHFHSQIRRFDLPAIRLTEVSGSPQHVTRSKRRLARSPSDDFLINLQLSGRSKVVQDGRVAETAPGDLALYDASRPYELLMRTDYSHAAILEFDDLDGLKAYLEHPAHASLAEQFFSAFEDGLCYDFELGDVRLLA